MLSRQASALSSAPHEIRGQHRNFESSRGIFRAGVPRLKTLEARKGKSARKSRSMTHCKYSKFADLRKRKSNLTRFRGRKQANSEPELDNPRSAEYHSACFARGVSRRHPWGAQSRKPRLRGKDLGSGCLRKDGFDARLERHRAGEGYSYGCPVF